jgi:hypothetical protein
MENGRLALKQRERVFFGDFLHIHDDFAIKNATNIIFKAGKAQSYSSLHDLSNGAKRCKSLSRNRQEIDTAKALSIVIIQKKLILPRSIFLNFEYVSHACLACTPQRGLLAQPTPTACKQEALPAKV